MATARGGGRLLDGIGQDGSESVDSGSDLLQTFWTVVHTVVGCNVSQQGLCGTDVGRGLVTLDVLFSGLQGKTERWLAQTVLRDTNDSTRDLSVQPNGTPNL